MKSPMITHASYIKEEDKKNYSDLRVLRSAAGYYVGTIHHNPEGFDEPGSRDSFEYYATPELASEALKEIEADRLEARLLP